MMNPGMNSMNPGMNPGMNSMNPGMNMGGMNQPGANSMMG